MKKLSLIFVLILIIMLAFSAFPVAAQATTTPVPGSTSTPAPLLEGADVYPFSSMGFNDRIMNGPYDYISIHFSLPYNWTLKKGAAIQLHLISAFTSQSNLSESELVQATGATLDVSFNGKFLTTVVLDWSGERTITIPISDRALLTTTPGQHYVSLYLNAAIDCKLVHHTTVSVISDSRLDLQHDIINPGIDLVQFPFPIYQENSFLPNSVISASAADPITALGTVPPAALVTSDNPSAAEMQAALIVSAGLGRLTSGNLPLTTLPISKLTDQIKQSYHLIFVGKGDGFTTLKDLALPVIYDGKTFKSADAQPDDGLIQEAVSPWDPSKVILVVSGESDAGILKAAQAISSGVIRVGERPDLAIVSEITPGKVINSVPDDRTLADLGYETAQITGVGYGIRDYLFVVPAGLTLREAASFDVVFTNSTMLNFTQSGLSVLLNGQSIGGVRVSADTAKSITTEKLNIPQYLLRAGMNRLTIQVINMPLYDCSDVDLNNMWTSILNQSVLHIPLAPSTSGVAKQITLADHKDFLTSSPTLDSTAFIVAPNSPTAIMAASQIAFQLGSLMTGGSVELKAVYADQVPDSLRKNYDLVVVGRASQLPIIAELGTDLPAAFDKGSDVAQESVFKVIYRISPNISIGYLELLTSPWDSTRNILTVLGSTDEGLSYASNALTNAGIQAKLGGNYAIVRNEQVITADTRAGVGTGNISATLIPEVPQETQIPTDIPAAVTSEQSPFANPTNWVLPGVGISSVLIIIIIIVVFFKSRQNR
jgi:cellulose synthase operon protein B